MDVVIIAADDVQIHELVMQVTTIANDASIKTFVDPFLALKYLYSYKTNLVFVMERIKTIPAGKVVNLIRRNCKDIDITVIAEDMTIENEVLKTGAHRLITGTITKEVLDSILQEIKIFEDT